MFQIQTISTTRKASALAVLAAIGASGMAASQTQAATIQIRDFTGSSVEDGWTHAVFDDATMWSGSHGDLTWGTRDNVELGDDDSKRTVLGVKDLFSVLPPADNGQQISIISAQLRLFALLGATSADQHNYADVYINRLTTDWMTGPAGDNEDTVINNGGWANGAFSSADYTTDGESVTIAYDNRYHTPALFDITEVIAGIYASGQNYGMVIRGDYSPYAFAHLSMGSSEHETLDWRPALLIEYEYVVPEPASLSLLALGGLLAMRWRRS